MQITRRGLFGMVAAAVVAPRVITRAHTSTRVRTGLPAPTWRLLNRLANPPLVLDAKTGLVRQLQEPDGALVRQLLMQTNELLEDLPWK